MFFWTFLWFLPMIINLFFIRLITKNTFWNEEDGRLKIEFEDFKVFLFAYAWSLIPIVNIILLIFTIVVLLTDLKSSTYGNIASVLLLIGRNKKKKDDGEKDKSGVDKYV